VLSWIVLAPSPAVAGNITYTWVEDDGQSVQGSLVVLGSAQTAGSITFNDVVSFESTIFGFDIGTADLTPTSFPLPISTATSEPDGAVYTYIAGATYIAGVVDAIPFQFEFDRNWSVPSGELMGIDDGGGRGHWVITGASSVPEPPSHVLAGVGIISGLAYGWSRHRRQQRRQAAALQVQANQRAHDENQGAFGQTRSDCPETAPRPRSR
jgi:hypothetical protein